MATGLICPKCNERFPVGHSECPKDKAPLADARIADALVGRSLGNFQVERILGAGGMGLVFAAKHKAIGTRAVVKVLSPEMIRIRDAKIRFLNEAKLASAVNHPNIVRIFDFGETVDHLVYMIMEYVPGEDLDAILETEKRLHPVRAAKILRQVASALEAAHSAPGSPVIHRDLKPANIRISPKGREEHVTVLDFGIAKALEHTGEERLTQVGMVVGTPRYMSPEQACGDAVDTRSDIYSLGVIAYEVVSGHTPYQTSRLVELISHQLHSPIPAFQAETKVPKAYTEIVMRCLAFEPQNRFASATELAEAFQGFLDAESSRSIRRRAAIGVGGALLLGGAIATAAVVFGPTEGVTEALALASLKVDARDAKSAASVYVRGERAVVEGTIDGLAKLAALKPEVKVSLAGKEVEGVEVREGGFEAIIGPLAPGSRSALEVAVVYGEAEKRKTATVLKDRAIVRDVKAPQLALEGVERRAGEVLLFRTREGRFEVGVRDDGELAAHALSLRAATPSIRARMGEIAAGRAPVTLDFSGAADNESTVIAVTAADAAANESTLRVQVRFDPAPPEVTLAGVEGAEGPAGEGDEAAYIVRAGPQAPLPRDVRIAARASDASGIERVALDVAEAPTASSARVIRPEQGQDFSQPAFTVTLRDEGLYRFRLSATDLAGNVTSTGTFAVRCAVELRLQELQLRADEGDTLAFREDARYPVSAGAIEISGRANKALRAVEVERAPEGAPAVELAGSLEGERKFRARVDLVPRVAQRITVRVLPEQGEPISRACTVLHDDEAPEIALVRPAPWPDVFSGRTLSDGAIAIERRASDALDEVASDVVRAFGVEDEEAAKRLAEAIERDGIERASVGALRLAVDERGGQGKARVVPAADTKFVVVALEARDRAGNRTTLARRARLEGQAAQIELAAPTSVRVHERITIKITLSKPVATLRVNGSTDGVSKKSETLHVYEADMFLDTPETYTIEAVDSAGNAATKHVKVARETFCRKLETDDGVNMRPVDRPVDVADAEETYRTDGQAVCIWCKKPLYSGRKTK